MLRESQDRGEGRTVLTSKDFQKYLKKDFTVFKFEAEM